MKIKLSTGGVSPTMSNDYLSRGRCKDTNEWVHGFYVEAVDVIANGKKSYIIPVPVGFYGRGEFTGACEIFPETICRFTGLYDSTKWEQLTEEEKQVFFDVVQCEQVLVIEEAAKLWKGRHVFEGDRVFSQRMDNAYLVSFSDGAFWVQDQWGNRINTTQGAFYRMQVVVTGSVFDGLQLVEKLGKTCGNLMTIDKFRECVACNGFIPYDGYGYYCTETELSDLTVSFNLEEIDRKKKSGYGFVLWFNR